MSNGKKGETSPSASDAKKVKKPPKGYEQWFIEYREMVRLSGKSEARGQTDTYWHSRKAELEAAFKEYDLEVPNG